MLTVPTVFVFVFSLSLSLSLASSFCWSVIVFACWLHPLIISKKRGGIILWKPILDQKWILSALIGLARCTAHELSAKPIDNCPDRLLHSTEPIDNCPRGTLQNAKPPTYHSQLHPTPPPASHPARRWFQPNHKSKETFESSKTFLLVGLLRGSLCSVRWWWWWWWGVNSANCS